MGGGYDIRGEGEYLMTKTREDDYDMRKLTMMTHEDGYDMRKMMMMTHEDYYGMRKNMDNPYHIIVIPKSVSQFFSCRSHSLASPSSSILMSLPSSCVFISTFSPKAQCFATMCVNWQTNVSKLQNISDDGYA